MPEFDQALSALLSDLVDRGLLDDTLVLVMGEFGRTPRINNADRGGRDHWSRAYTALLAGGPIRGGIVHGRTDSIAGEVRDFPVCPDDFAATLYESLGIPQDTIQHDLRQRPHRIAEGEPSGSCLDDLTSTAPFSAHPERSCHGNQFNRRRCILCRGLETDRNHGKPPRKPLVRATVGTIAA